MKEFIKNLWKDAVAPAIIGYTVAYFVCSMLMIAGDKLLKD